MSPGEKDRSSFMSDLSKNSNTGFEIPIILFNSLPLIQVSYTLYDYSDVQLLRIRISYSYGILFLRLIITKTEIGLMNYSYEIHDTLKTMFG